MDSQGLDRTQECPGHLPQDLVARDGLAPVLAEEEAQVLRPLQQWHIAVQENAVHTLVLEDHVVVE